MAPHAGTAGLKVLLAGTSHDDLNEAQQFLTSEGAIGLHLRATMRFLPAFPTAS